MAFEEAMVEVGVLSEDIGRGAPSEESLRDEFLIFCAGGVLVEELSFVVHFSVPEKYVGDGTTPSFVSFCKNNVLFWGALLTELHLYRCSKTWASSCVHRK